MARSLFTFPIFVFCLFAFYLFSIEFHFLQSVPHFLILNDEISLFMSYMSFFVLIVSFMFTSPSFSLSNNLVFIFMLLFCIGVFCTSNVFLLYFFYEASLLPIIFIIINWGSYPERSLSALMLLIYTSLFTLPLLAVITVFFISESTFTLPLLAVITVNWSPSAIFSMIVFFSFAVKLPIYGLHFWLPMAHVEAPTFGSIILAGVLLKLGGVGLIRFSLLFSSYLVYSCFFVYLIVFLVFVPLICSYQSDFKRLVAYSSVSHMITIPLILLAAKSIANNAIVLVILFHGLSSPVLFMLVGLSYSLYSTRQLIYMRGLVLVSPLLTFLTILAFFFTLSAPPFPSFVSEVFFILASYSLSPYMYISLVLFGLLSLIYNLNWLSSLLFGPLSFTTPNFNLSYSAAICFFSSLALSFEFLLLLSFF